MPISLKNNYGLSDRDIQTIINIFIRYSEIETVHIFGSRAKDNFKPASDIDLAIMNNGVSLKIISKIKSDFEESSLPYKVDLALYPSLKNPELKEHIDRVGKLFYQKGEMILHSKK
jgi:predicted nucleotidyltransferase